MDTHDSSEYLNIHPGGNNREIKNNKGYFTKEARLKGLEVRRQHIRDGLYVVTEEVRKKRSIGIKNARKNKPAWNKGLTKETDPRVAACGKHKHPPVYDDARRARISKISKGTLWYNNGKI